MPSPQDQFDDAMFSFSMADYDAAIEKLQRVLEVDPEHFDAVLALGMAYYRKGDYPAAIAEGHRAETLRPREQLVHTNLSLFYVKVGDKQKAEHHGLQARIASWREGTGAAPAGAAAEPELKMASEPAPTPMRFSGRLPEMPWKKQAPPQPGARGAGAAEPETPADPAPGE